MTSSKRVLIVEDDPNKARQLAEFVRAEFLGVSVVVRSSFQSGLLEILTADVDVACVDMSLPTYDVSAREKGGRPRAYGGRDILREATRRGRQVPIIVVTQLESFGEGADALTLDQLKIQLAERFSSNYVGTVFYQPAESSWRAELADQLRGVLER